MVRDRPAGALVVPPLGPPCDGNETRPTSGRAPTALRPLGPRPRDRSLPPRFDPHLAAPSTLPMTGDETRTRVGATLVVPTAPLVCAAVPPVVPDDPLLIGRRGRRRRGLDDGRRRGGCLFDDGRLSGRGGRRRIAAHVATHRAPCHDGDHSDEQSTLSHHDSSNQGSIRNGITHGSLDRPRVRRIQTARAPRPRMPHIRCPVLPRLPSLRRARVAFCHARLNKFGRSFVAVPSQSTRYFGCRIVLAREYFDDTLDR